MKLQHPFSLNQESFQPENYFYGYLNMARVLLDNIYKVYDGGVVAVKGASLDIADKEFMVIVGPSGCGKTTSLRMIAGLEDVSDGTITIGDSVVNDVPPKDRDVAMVFQNYALYPHMTVFQNMAFGLKLRKLAKTEIKQRVEETARMLGIAELLKRKPKALSGGQRQRAALGRAIVRKPKAFLFDEPLSNLDAKLRVTMRSELKALHRRLAATSIYVTHDQAEAMTLGDRICVMYDGQIQQVAQPLDVYERPVNRFVAGFLGTPGMNFLEGTLQAGDNRVAIVCSGNKIKLPVSMAKYLTVHHGRGLVLGFRAEHLSLETNDEKCDSFLLATVEVVEPLGDRTDVYFSVDGVSEWLVGNLEPHVQLKPLDAVKIYIKTQKCHVFEPGDLGMNLTLGRPGKD